MKVGTKSVLFGAHQFLLHPLFVALAWWQLYGFPWDPRLWVAFFVHDLGYLGKPNMDGPEGEEHPRLGARIMMHLFDDPDQLYCLKSECEGCPTCDYAHEQAFRWHDFTLHHSRFMAKKNARPFSRLCVADKLATALVPAWLYLLLANLTGEIHEYMDIEGGKYGRELRALGSQRAWFESLCEYLRGWVAEHRDGRADTWTPRRESEGA